MSIGEKIMDALLTHPVLKVIRIIVGWIIALCAGLMAVSCTICAPLALFGGLELDSFGERLCYAVLYIALALIFLYLMKWGRRLKNGNIRKSAAKSEPAKSEDNDFRDIKRKILLEAHRLVKTYDIDTKHRCKSELCEFEEFVRTLKTYSGNDHDFITLHLGKYSYQLWERGQCIFGFDGDTEEDFIEKFLTHLFFDRCRSCYKGHYLCVEFDRNAEMNKQICCTDIITGRQCYANTSQDAFCGGQRPLVR